MSTTRLLMILFGSIGIIFVTIGGPLFAFLALPAVEENANRVEQLVPQSVSRLQDREIGQEVLIEGRLSEENPTQAFTFVVYIKKKLVKRFDKEKWEVEQEVTPALWLEVPDGLIQIENDSYFLASSHSYYYDRTTSYDYLEAGDQVIAVGKVTANEATPPRISAEFLALGSQNDYIASQRSSASILRIISGLFFCLGGFSILVSIGVGLAAWRVMPLSHWRDTLTLKKGYPTNPPTH